MLALFPVTTLSLEYKNMINIRKYTSSMMALTLMGLLEMLSAFHGFYLHPKQISPA